MRKKFRTKVGTTKTKSIIKKGERFIIILFVGNFKFYKYLVHQVIQNQIVIGLLQSQQKF